MFVDICVICGRILYDNFSCHQVFLSFLDIILLLHYSVYLEVDCAAENFGGGALHEDVVVVAIGDDEVASTK